MMRFRRVGTMKKETIQQMINRGDWKGSIRFIQSDYNTESYFSKQGDSLIEVAIKADAENYSRYSQLILKKVLDDYNYYKTKGKTITSITQNKHLGHLILEHGKSDAAKQEIIRYLARHPSTKQRLPHIINTHHYNGTNTRHLSNHANALGNKQTAQTIRNLLQRQKNSVHMFNMSALHNLVNQQLRENRKNNNIKSNTGMSNVSSSAGTVRRPPPPVSMSGLTGQGPSQASAAPNTKNTPQRMNNVRKPKTQRNVAKEIQALAEEAYKISARGTHIGQNLSRVHLPNRDVNRLRNIRKELNNYNTPQAIGLKQYLNQYTFVKSNQPANSQGSQRSNQT